MNSIVVAVWPWILAKLLAMRHSDPIYDHIQRTHLAYGGCQHPSHAWLIHADSSSLRIIVTRVNGSVVKRSN